jgi:hypothetical protein
MDGLSNCQRTGKPVSREFPFPGRAFFPDQEAPERSLCRGWHPVFWTRWQDTKYCTVQIESGASVSQQCILSEPMALAAGIRTVLEGPKPASRLIRLR